MVKKVRKSWVLILLVMITVVGSSGQSALAAPYVSDTTYALGNQGVFIPAGFNTDAIEVRKVSQKTIGWTPIEFRRPLLVIDFVGQTQAVQTTQQQNQDDQATQDGQTTQGTSIGLGSTPVSLTYVFYKLNQGERARWENGNLSIWYLDMNTGQWQRCNSFLVNGGQNQDEDADDGDGDTRLACVAPQYTMFGLGRARE